MQKEEDQLSANVAVDITAYQSTRREHTHSRSSSSLSLLSVFPIGSCAISDSVRQSVHLSTRYLHLSYCRGRWQHQDQRRHRGQQLCEHTTWQSKVKITTWQALVQSTPHFSKSTATAQPHLIKLISRMQQALRHEAEYFDEKKRLLRAIFNETLAQCADAYRSKNVPKGKSFLIFYLKQLLLLIV